MGSQTGIAWTDHTFNPWRGCTKVSAGCANCYAEKMSHRNPAVLGEWGPAGRRVMAAPSYWRLPVQWDAAAKRDGVRRRVFCASLADVFEDRPELDAPRRSLFAAIAATPNLDWLLLTKRPENITRLMPEAGLPNVWLGTSVEDQATADARIPILLDTPAAVRFVSYEPALEAIDIRRWLAGSMDPALPRAQILAQLGRPGIAWAIVGGESGPKARPFDVGWARSVVEQCRRAGVPCFVKQLGARTVVPAGRLRHHEWPHARFEATDPEHPSTEPWRVRLRDRAGADPAEWPEDLRVREFPR